MVVQLQRQPAAAAAAPRAQVQLRAATWRMCAVQALLACAALAAAAPPQQQQQQCSQPRQGEPGAITDLTVPVRAGLPVWEQAAGLRRNWRALSQSQEEGEVVNQSHLNLDAHTGTHIDAPYHFLPDGGGIDTLPLASLVGPAYVIEVSGDTNVTGDVLAAAPPPADARRLLFKTQNSRRGLMGATAFASDYVGLDSSAARWLAAERPDVILVGIDYLSIGMLDDIVETHKTLFRTGTVVVEGLNLTAAAPGAHHLTCLPLLLVGSDGAPARCILTPLAA